MKTFATELSKSKEEFGKIIDEIINLDGQNYEEALQNLLLQQEYFAVAFQFHHNYLKREISYDEFRNLTLKALKTLILIFLINFYKLN